jgi:predicted 3-demethylubiquinone-9 3-methyltransferase (glyoxalase superfamily)
MPKISPFLWFDDTAEEAGNFYASIFPNSSVEVLSRNPDTGRAFGVRFVIDGLEVSAMNAGPMFPFTEAFSLYVDVETQKEIDYYWDALRADGGEESQCGWLKDQFGLSWQVVPRILGELMSSPDAAAAGRATQAMFGMKKLVIADLEAAAAG